MKTEETTKDNKKRLAECEALVMTYIAVQGHMAREAMSREELEEKIDNGITAQELDDELYNRIQRIPGIILGTHKASPDLRVKQSLTQRARHTYIIGRSGSGKTNLIRSMLLQDIYLGHGVGVIAPEAELLTDEIMPYIPPERIDDVVYINPADYECPISINPLYTDDDDISDKVEDMVTIFKRIVGETGARMDHVLNNALYALIERRSSTLLDVTQLLTDPDFQQEIIRTTGDEQTRDFFKFEYPSLQKRDAHQPIITRLSMFTRRKAIRNILCQRGKGFDFRKAMDEGKIILVNLSDGILGMQTAQILGQIIFSKFQLATFSRADSSKLERRPFYLYMDEFQAFVGVNEASYESMLSRARKYRLSLILANQETHQLSSDLLHAILGNVSTIITFSVSRADADKLAREYMFDTGGEMIEMPSEELLRLKVGEAWGKIGQTIFPLQTHLVDQNPDHRRTKFVIERSRLNYGVQTGKKPDTDTRPDNRSLPPHEDKPHDDEDEDFPDPGKVF